MISFYKDESSSKQNCQQQRQHPASSYMPAASSLSERDLIENEARPAAGCVLPTKFSPLPWGTLILLSVVVEVPAHIKP